MRRLLSDMIAFCIYPMTIIMPAKLKDSVGRRLGWHWESVGNELSASRYYDDFRSLSLATVREHYRGLDVDSVRCATRYVRLTQIFNKPERIRRFLYTWFHLWTEERVRSRDSREAQFRRIVEMHRLNDCYQDYASWVYHHGLRDLPDAVLRSMRGKVFIDAGAYVGDSTIVLLDYGPSSVCAFEPSRINQDRYLRAMRDNDVSLDRVTLVGKGLSSESYIGTFSDSGSMCTRLHGEGDQVEITTLDEYVQRRELEVGLIKADLEGMGLKMIKGATQTILKDLPVLSLAIYHNQDEFLGIYSYLRSITDRYRYKIVSLCPPWQNLELTLLAFRDYSS